jgi:hypothetical protein
MRVVPRELSKAFAPCWGGGFFYFLAKHFFDPAKLQNSSGFCADVWNN